MAKALRHHRRERRGSHRSGSLSSVHSDARVADLDTHHETIASDSNPELSAVRAGARQREPRPAVSLRVAGRLLVARGYVREDLGTGGLDDSAPSNGAWATRGAAQMIQKR